MTQTQTDIRPNVIVVDFGSQYTKVISRTLREMGYRSVIIPPERVMTALDTMKPKAVILSGGSASVYETDAPSMPKEVLEYGIPILGICYGMQWISHQLGGKVVAELAHKEYSETWIKATGENHLLPETDEHLRVWASHGDSVKQVPPGFKVLAKSEGTDTIAAMGDQQRNIWGLQFHPEVTQTDRGKELLDRFLCGICGCQGDWEPQNIVHEIQEEVREAIGNGKVLLGLSGGVDSTTMAAALVPVLDEKLLGVCINHGGLRLNEIAEIEANAAAAGVQLRIIDAVDRFQTAIGDAVDAEEKRKRFKKLYGTILEEAAADFEAEFLLQGSLATDIIESGKVGNAALIKSHHNVGLDLDLKELHPFRNLFKYEVRDIARRLGLPPSVTERHPFPGPGLYLRVIGKPATIERLEIVRWADALVTRILKKHKVYDQISQLIVAFVCVDTVGIKGDARAYKGAIVVRPVFTQDFMTLEGYQIPDHVRREISREVTKHPEIVRVWYDETNKPPATTELE